MAGLKIVLHYDNVCNCTGENDGFGLRVDGRRSEADRFLIRVECRKCGAKLEVPFNNVHVERYEPPERAKLEARQLKLKQELVDIDVKLEKLGG